MSEINQAKLTGYLRLIVAGRRQIEEIPEPYRTEVEKNLNKGE